MRKIWREESYNLNMNETFAYADLDPSTNLPQSLETADPSLMTRRVNESDAAWLVGLAQSPDVAMYLPFASVVTDEATAEQLIVGWAQEQDARYVIELEHSPVGYFAVFGGADDGIYETESALLPEYRGRGIVNTVYAAMEKEIRERLHARGVIAHIDENNESSRRMILKRGYTPAPDFDPERQISPRYEKHFG